MPNSWKNSVKTISDDSNGNGQDDFNQLIQYENKTHENDNCNHTFFENSALLWKISDPCHRTYHEIDKAKLLMRNISSTETWQNKNNSCTNFDLDVISENFSTNLLHRNSATDTFSVCSNKVYNCKIPCITYSTCPSCLPLETAVQKSYSKKMNTCLSCCSRNDEKQNNMKKTKQYPLHLDAISKLRLRSFIRSLCDDKCNSELCKPTVNPDEENSSAFTLQTGSKPTRSRKRKRNCKKKSLTRKGNQSVLSFRITVPKVAKSIVFINDMRRKINKILEKKKRNAENKERNTDIGKVERCANCPYFSTNFDSPEPFKRDEPKGVEETDAISLKLGNQTLVISVKATPNAENVDCTRENRNQLNDKLTETAQKKTFCSSPYAHVRIQESQGHSSDENNEYQDLRSRGKMKQQSEYDDPRTCFNSFRPSVRDCYQSNRECASPKDLKLTFEEYLEDFISKRLNKPVEYLKNSHKSENTARFDMFSEMVSCNCPTNRILREKLTTLERQIKNKDRNYQKKQSACNCVKNIDDDHESYSSEQYNTDEECNCKKNRLKSGNYSDNSQSRAMDNSKKKDFQTSTDCFKPTSMENCIYVDNIPKKCQCSKEQRNGENLSCPRKAKKTQVSSITSEDSNSDIDDSSFERKKCFRSFGRCSCARSTQTGSNKNVKKFFCACSTKIMRDLKKEKIKCECSKSKKNRENDATKIFKKEECCQCPPSQDNNMTSTQTVADEDATNTTRSSKVMYGEDVKETQTTDEDEEIENDMEKDIDTTDNIERQKRQSISETYNVQTVPKKSSVVAQSETESRDELCSCCICDEYDDEDEEDVEPTKFVCESSSETSVFFQHSEEEDCSCPSCHIKVFPKNKMDKECRCGEERDKHEFEAYSMTNISRSTLKPFCDTKNLKYIEKSYFQNYERNVENSSYNTKCSYRQKRKKTGAGAKSKKGALTENMIDNRCEEFERLINDIENYWKDKQGFSLLQRRRCN